MGMKILVTGVNGFVGSAVLRSLIENPDNVIVGVDIADYCSVNLSREKAGFLYVEGNCTDERLMASLQEHHHFDVIIHLAALLNKGTELSEYYAVMNANVHSTELLLRLAKHTSARFIFPSTAMVYGNSEGPFTEAMPLVPGNYYAFSKASAEQLIRMHHQNHSIPHVIFRIGILYGPGQRGNMFIPSLVNALVSNAPFPMTAGEQKRDFIHINDFVAALNSVLAQPELSGTFNLSSGTPLTMKEVALHAERIANKENIIRLGAIPYREHEIWNYHLSIDKFCKATGWTPNVTIDTGLEETITFAQERHLR